MHQSITVSSINDLSRNRQGDIKAPERRFGQFDRHTFSQLYYINIFSRIIDNIL